MTDGFTVPTTGLPYIDKDPDAVLDYTFNWTDWLDGDTIVSVSYTVPTGLTKDTQTYTTTHTTVWLSGGAAGQTYTVTGHVVTAGGREDDRSFDVNVVQR